MGWAGEVWWEVDPSWADPSYLYRRQRLGDQHFYVNKWLWKAFFHQSTPPSFPFFLPPHLPSFSLFCPLSFSLSSFPSHTKTHFLDCLKIFLRGGIQTSYSFLSAFGMSSAVHFEDDWQTHEFRDAIKRTMSYVSWKESPHCEPASESLAITVEEQSSRWVSNLEES